MVAEDIAGFVIAFIFGVPIGVSVWYLTWQFVTGKFDEDR